MLEEGDQKKATECLAAVALVDRRPDLLKFCLDREFATSGWFLDAANSFEEGNAGSDISKVLQASEFRQKWPLPKPEKHSRENGDPGEETDPAEAFDEGGEYPVDW
jgi:hypothetical protein